MCWYQFCYWRDRQNDRQNQLFNPTLSMHLWENSVLQVGICQLFNPTLCMHVWENSVLQVGICQLLNPTLCMHVWENSVIQVGICQLILLASGKFLSYQSNMSISSLETSSLTQEYSS